MKDEKDDRVGIAFITSSIPPTVSGYGGEIDVLVGMDMFGSITGMKIIGHGETPNFVEQVIESGFLQKFVGRNSSDSFSDIEVVTGATITSQAIIDDIKAAIPAVAGEILKDARRMPGHSWIFDMKAIRLAGVIAMIAAAIVVAFLPRLRTLRTGVLILSIAVIGIWQNTPITIGNLVDFRNMQISISAGLPIVMLIIFAFIASLAKGNLYCAHLCPFGALQSIVGKLRVPKICPSNITMKNMGYLRWIIAIVSIYAIAGLGSISFRFIEPFSLCFSHKLDKAALIQAAAVIIAAIFVGRVWCRFFCPTGLVFDLFAMLGAKIRYGLKGYGRRNKQ